MSDFAYASYDVEEDSVALTIPLRRRTSLVVAISKIYCIREDGDQ